MEQAKGYLAKSEFEKAKISYLSALQLDPQNSEAYKEIGLIWSEQGSPLQAARFLGKARELLPNDSNVRVKLARAFISLQAPAEARKEAEAVLQRNPEQLDALDILTQAVASPAENQDLQARLQKLDQTNVSVQVAEARLALNRNDLLAAEAAANKAREMAPNSDASHLLLGGLALIKKDLRQAEDEFKLAADLAPRSPASLLYAQTLLQRDPNAGAQYLSQLAAKLADYVPLWLLQAKSAAGNNHFDEALAALQQVFQIDPTNSEGRFLQGQVFLAKGDADKAIDLLKNLNRDPLFAQSAAAKYELARAYLLKSNQAQAITLLDEAIKLQPEYAEAILLLGELRLQRGEGREVVGMMDAFSKRRPGFLPGMLLLARAYQSLGNFADASRVLLEQLKATPQAVEPRVLLGLLQLQQNQRAAARKSFEQAAKVAPESLLVASYLIDMDVGDKNFVQALQRAETFVRDQPNAAGASFLLARVYVAQERWNEAEEALKRSIAQDPNLTGAYDLLVSIYLKNNQLKLASSELEAIVSRNRKDTRALAILGGVQEKLQDWSKAKGTYEMVLAVDPNSAAAMNNLAVLNAEHFDQLDKAYELASRARTLRPDDASVADTLGWILYKRRDYPQAVSLLRESADKLPSSPEVQFHYGMASYMTGAVEVAKKALIKAASAPQEFPGKGDIPATLATLGENAGSAKSLSNDALETALKQRPDDIVARQSLADRYERDGNVVKAASLWEEALKVNPRLSSALVKLAQLNAGPLHEPNKAFDYAKRARSLAPNDPEIAVLAGRTAYQSGNFTAAYNILQAPALLPNALAEVVRDFAWAAYYQGKVDEAQKAMQRALTAAPDSPGAAGAKQFLEFVALEDQPGDLAAKAKDVGAVLSADALNVPALMLQARLDVQQNRIEVANAIYAGVLARLPDFSLAQKRLSSLYLKQPGRLNDAFDLATKARKNLPDDPEVAQTLAAIRYQRKEYASVVQLLQESSAKRPLSAELLFYLGMSRLQQKQKSEGYSTLEQALTAGLEGPEAAEAKSTLAAKTGS